MELGEQLLDACFNDIEQVEWLINHNDKLIVNWKDSKNNYSILHMLCYSNLNEPLELLLNAGANPNIKNKVNYFIIILFIFINIVYFY